MLEAVEGGTALHVRHLATAQTGRHTVAVAVPEARSSGRTDSALLAELDAAGVHIHRIAMRRNPLHPGNVPAAVSLLRFVRTWRPDVIHAHSTVGGLFGRSVARLARVPAVHTQNGAIFADTGRHPSAVAARVVERLQRRLTDALIAVSVSEADALRPLHRPGVVVVVPNGIPVLDDPPTPMPDPPVVVAVSRFVFQKEPLLTVRVMSEARRLVPGARALLVGYGELEADVRRLIAELDPGIEVRSDVAGVDAIATSTVLLLTSRFEGAPYVLLEAMARGRPVVATDVVGSRDAVDDGVTGVLFPFGDVSQGAAAVARLLEQPSLAASMGDAGRRRVRESFSIDGMVAGVEDVYESLVAR